MWRCCTSGPTASRPLRFPLPQKPLEVLRFDPLDGEGEVFIRRMRILDERRRVVRTIDPTVLTPLHQIASIRPERDGVRVITTPRADDPMLVTRASWLVESPRWYRPAVRDAVSLAWIAVAVVVLDRNRARVHRPRDPCRSILAARRTVAARAAPHRRLGEAGAPAAVSRPGALLGSMGRRGA